MTYREILLIIRISLKDEGGTMAQLEVLRFPDKRLRNKAMPVEQFDAQLKKLVDDMFETMYAENGIGLAAIQVNVPKAVLVIDLGDSKPIHLINPQLISKEGQCINEEGCLSVPGYFAKVKRAAKITVRANKLDGSTWELQAEGLLSVCVQHEIDHLHGKMFVDYLSPLKREMVLRRMNKLAGKRSSAAA